MFMYQIRYTPSPQSTIIFPKRIVKRNSAFFGHYPRSGTADAILWYRLNLLAHPRVRAAATAAIVTSLQEGTPERSARVRERLSGGRRAMATIMWNNKRRYTRRRRKPSRHIPNNNISWSRRPRRDVYYTTDAITLLHNRAHTRRRRDRRRRPMGVHS